MIRVLPLSLAFAYAAVVGCSNAPGKPKPVVNDGVPTPVMAFAPLYSTYCAGCHGAEGKLGPAPPLNDPLFLKIISDEELTSVVANGRSGTSMPAFLLSKGGLLNAAQVKVLVEGLRSQWSKPEYPGDVPTLSGTLGDVERGKSLFTMACASCHGEDGKGGTFEGQPVGAINEPAFLTLSTNAVLRRLIITGRPDLGMPNFAGKSGRPAGFKPLTNSDVSDLAAVLASWRRP